MELSTGYGRDMSVENYVRMFEDIYFATKNHERTDTQIICRLLENVGNVGKFVLKEPAVEGIGRHLGRTFAWYCALAIRLGRKNIGDYVWRKFPYACAYCGAAPCACGNKKRAFNETGLQLLRSRNLSRRPRSLIEFQTMFSTIYIKRNVDTLVENAFAGVQSVLPFSEPELTTNLQVALAAAFGRLVEELGELTASIRLRYFDAYHVEDEMADIFAWLMGISNLLDRSGAAQGRFELADYVWSEYPGYCRFCGNHRCKCTAESVEDVVSVAGILISRHLDTLTGLGNRDAWNELCKTSEKKSANVNKSLPLSLIMLDLDGFKAVNDQFGHQQGDIVLEEVAHLIQAIAVPPGQGFRLGGDEFCVVISNLSKSEVRILAEKLCEAVKAHQFANMKGGDSLKVGASFGVETVETVTTEENGAENKMLSWLYAKADERMYEAKQRGKGQVR